jgi:hypothetical protein
METDQVSVETKTGDTPAATANVQAKQKQAQNILIPEVDLYIHLLVLLFAIDQKKHKQVLI